MFASATSTRWPPGAPIDLSYDYSDQTVFWPTAESFKLEQVSGGVSGAAGVATLHFPGLHPDAVRWLAESRRVKAVGLDTASIDYGQTTLYESHRTLFEHDIPAFENLTNHLDRLPATGAFVVALPMKIKGGSGAPLRAVAFLP